MIPWKPPNELPLALVRLIEEQLERFLAAVWWLEPQGLRWRMTTRLLTVYLKAHLNIHRLKRLISGPLNVRAIAKSVYHREHPQEKGRDLGPPGDRTQNLNLNGPYHSGSLGL